MVLKSLIYRNLAIQAFRFSSVRAQTLLGSIVAFIYVNFEIIIWLMQSDDVSCIGKGCISVKIGVKQIQLGQKLQYGLIMTNQDIQILDLIYQDVSMIIRRMAYPRSMKISKCQNFVVASFTDNTVGIYSIRDGSQISKVLGIPRSVNSFVISGNSKKLLFANNQTLCIWDIPKGQLQISSNQWRNINCYAIRDDGKQLAIGTYSGSILILTLLSNQKLTEMQSKRHKNCVMLIGYCKNGSIISLSYDRLFLTTTISKLPNGQKGISYSQVIMQSIPRSIHQACNIVFFSQSDGSIGWLQGTKLILYSQGMYTVTQYEHSLVFAKYRQGEIEWFQKSV